MARVEDMRRMRVIDASEERQTMQGDGYEVYMKLGPSSGAAFWHSHDFHEIIYLLEGQYTSQVGEVPHELRKGDFLLIGRNTPHRYLYDRQAHEGSRRIVLWVSGEMLEALAGADGNPLGACFRDGTAEVYHFPLHYEDLLEGFLMKLAMSELIDDVEPGMRRNVDKGYLLLFFSYLNVLCQRHDHIYADSAIARNALVEAVDRYIEAHLEEPISIDALAEEVHLSKYYFVRRFKELTGVTAHNWLIDRRLARACELLRSGEEIMNVYSQVGFSDYSVFLRNFRKLYGMSPREYGHGGGGV